MSTAATTEQNAPETEVDMPTRAETETRLAAQVETVGSWRAQVEAARADLADLEREDVEDLLDDPEAVQTLSSRIAAARERIGLSERALTIAQEREHAARVEVVRAAARDMEPDIEAARAVLADHEAKTEKLKAALEKHAGGEWVVKSEAQAREEQLGNELTGQYVWHRPKSIELRENVARLERRRALLLGAAEGHDVHQVWAELHPAIPGAIWSPPVPELTAADCPPELRAGGILPTPGVPDPRGNDAGPHPRR